MTACQFLICCIPVVEDSLLALAKFASQPLSTSHSPLATAFRYSAGPMLDLGYVREHLDVIEKMARDRGVTLDLAAFRELDAERRQIITSIERLKAERNNASGEIARLGKIVHGGDKAKEQIKEQIKEHAAG